MSHEPVYLLRRRRRVAALIDADDLAELIEAAEDLEDLRAAEAARQEMADSGESPVPWEEVKAELGLA
ncbi:prevent-host-death protein [Arthrobacter crystallopoietes BAB-32]|uniref:Antitoxin n=2 Tax=Crystallibacter crystallopoietes TaxID=37928 RepID=N1VC12_9MICC|nr:prevent-host-death protein [Arthrobacter crystallopoietes BAB-32]